jgi:simple sugar transport system substrate-binding protein
MTAYAPKAHLGSAIEVWGPYYTRVAEAWLAGKPFKENIWWGMKEGMNDFININKIVPEAAQKQVAAKKAEIVAGKFHPFTGPIKGNAAAPGQGAGRQDAQRQGDRLDQLVRRRRRRQSAGQVK